MTPAQAQQAREWLSDCQFSDVEPEEIMAMGDEEITAAVRRHYDGGLAAFLQTCEQEV